MSGPQSGFGVLAGFAGLDKAGDPHLTELIGAGGVAGQPIVVAGKGNADCGRVIHRGQSLGIVRGEFGIGAAQIVNCTIADILGRVGHIQDRVGASAQKCSVSIWGQRSARQGFWAVLGGQWKKVGQGGPPSR